MQNPRIEINRGKCVSCGRCTEICPNVFRMNPKGKIEIIGDDPECAHSASDQCVTHAIKIKE